MKQSQTPPPVEPTAMRLMGSLSQLFRFAPLVIVVIVLWELAAPPAVSMIVNGLEKIGMGSAASILAQKDAQAAYEHDVQLAISEVEQLHDYYTKLASAHVALIQKAFDWEGEILQAQLRMVESTQWVGRVGTNIADIGCLLGMAASDPALAAGACGAAQDLRQGMAGEMVDVLEDNRSVIPQEMMKGFPTPDQILSPAYEALADKYRT